MSTSSTLPPYPSCCPGQTIPAQRYNQGLTTPLSPPTPIITLTDSSQKMEVLYSDTSNLADYLLTNGSASQIANQNDWPFGRQSKHAFMSVDQSELLLDPPPAYDAWRSGVTRPSVAQTAEIRARVTRGDARDLRSSEDCAIKTEAQEVCIGTSVQPVFCALVFSCVGFKCCALYSELGYV